jgi:hypothetical protein
MASEGFRPRWSCGFNIYSRRGAILTPDYPRRATLHPPGARMASEGLRVVSEGSSIGPWERTVQGRRRSG